MSADPDPFARHPNLRGKISDPMRSYFRTFRVCDMVREMQERGIGTEMIRTDADREASRMEALSGRFGKDLWVFAYGSLMWDPALIFDEVRRARVPTHQRCFTLKDVYGARGDPERPGVMAALDAGAGCDGLAFRIAGHRVDAESELLWRREMIGAAYTPKFLRARIDDGEIEVLAFVADHAAESIHPDLSHADQVRYAATGEGFLGTSLDYLRNIAEHFETLRIEDEHVTALLRDALAYRRTG